MNNFPFRWNRTLRIVPTEVLTAEPVAALTLETEETGTPDPPVEIILALPPVQPAPTPPVTPQPVFKLRFELDPILVLWATLLLAAVTHAFNMLKFPYFENDEGIYMSQGFDVLMGKGLANYTYWYDHPPVGWMQIAAWLGLTGGPLTFGMSAVSGRILMLVIHTGSSFFLFRLAHKISGQLWVGTLAVAIFSLSPLGLYFQRRVLLDNIMTFWILAALWLIVCRYRSSLGPIVLSALAYGIALLSKEVAIFFLPVLLYGLWIQLDRRHRVLALTAWLAIVFVIGWQWIVYALFKGELFESGTLLGGDNGHVSLIGTLKYQATRGNGQGIFSLDSDFWHNMRDFWLTRDPVIMSAGLVATFVNLILGWRRRALWLAALPALAIVVFLARGGLVIEYYIIPAIPFFALNLAVLSQTVWQAYWQRVFRPAPRWAKPGLRLVDVALLVSLVAFLANYLAGNITLQNNFTADQTTQQVQAMNWVEYNLPTDAFIVTDQYDLLDLQEHGMLRAHSHWKVARDPDVRDKILANDWHNIDYIMATPQAITDIDTAHLDILKKASEHSTLIKIFVGPAGWNVQVRRVDPAEITNLYVATDQAGPNAPVTRRLIFSIYSYKKNLAQANLLVQATAPDGQVLLKQVYPAQNLPKGQTPLYQIPLRLPAGIDPGSLKVEVGLFDQNWQETYLWQEYEKLLQ